MRRFVVSTCIGVMLSLACTDVPTSLSDEPDHLAPTFSHVAPLTAELTAPVFDLATGPHGTLVAAETFVGVTVIRPHSRQPATRLVAELGGVTAVAPIGPGRLLALTGGPLDPSFEPQAWKLYRVHHGDVREIADLNAFEHAANPDQVWNTLEPESNPFKLAPLEGGAVLVADAAANDVLRVDEHGSIDWVAVLTPRLVSTSNFKALIGCVEGDARPECGLPPEIPAQPVATSVAVGPDGAYYVGELIGFPSEPGRSRVWRVAPGSLHVLCPSDACTLFADGFTSIMDLAFGPDGTLYVVEFDEAGWLAVEIVSGTPLARVEGGTVNACHIRNGHCVAVARGLALPTSVTVAKDGRVWVVENDAIPFGTARVHPIKRRRRH